MGNGLYKNRSGPQGLSLTWFSNTNVGAVYFFVKHFNPIFLGCFDRNRGWLSYFQNNFSHVHNNTRTDRCIDRPFLKTTVLVQDIPNRMFPQKTQNRYFERSLYFRYTIVYMWKSKDSQLVTAVWLTDQILCLSK